MEKLNINKLSYRETQISGLIQALIHEVEPLINRLSSSDNINKKLATEIAVDLNSRSDAITSLLYAIQDLNFTNKNQLDLLDAYELEIKKAIKTQGGERQWD